MDKKELAKIMKRFNNLTLEEKSVAKKYFLFVSYERKQERHETLNEVKELIDDKILLEKEFLKQSEKDTETFKLSRFATTEHITVLMELRDKIEKLGSEI